MGIVRETIVLTLLSSLSTIHAMPQLNRTSSLPIVPPFTLKVFGSTGGNDEVRPFPFFPPFPMSGGCSFLSLCR